MAKQTKDSAAIRAETITHRRELCEFLVGKTIAGLRFDDLSYTKGPGDIDIIFTDGSEVEFYGSLEDVHGIIWTTLTPAEAAEEAERERTWKEETPAAEAEPDNQTIDEWLDSLEDQGAIP